MRELTNSIQQENDFTLKSDCKHYLYGPRSKGDTEIRLVGPTVEGQFLPQFDPSMGNGTEGLSEAFIAMDYVTFFGKKKYAMLAIPPEDGTKAPSAVSVFAKTIMDYVNDYPRTAPDEWRGWLGLKVEGQQGAPPRAILKKPRKHLFVQGYLYKNNGKPAREVNGKKLARWPVVMALPPTARTDIINRLTAPLDDTQELSDTNNKLGNLLGPNGKMLCIEPYEKTLSEGGTRVQTWYRCKVEPETENYYKAPTIPLTLKQNNEVWRPWDDILNVNEEPELTLRRIAATFSIEAVKFTFVEHPYWSQFLPKEFKTARSDAAKPAPAKRPTRPEADPVYDQEAEEAGMVAEPPPPPAPSKVIPRPPKPSPKPPPPPTEEYETPTENVYEPTEKDIETAGEYESPGEPAPAPVRKTLTQTGAPAQKRVDIQARIQTAMKRFGGDEEEAGGDE